MKLFLIVLAATAALLQIPAAYAYQFNLSLSVGGHETVFPSQAYGMLVIDTAGDGFDFLNDSKLLQGARFKIAGNTLGDDDIVLIAGAAPTDFGGSKRGFSLSYRTIDTISLGALQVIMPGMSVALVWFPEGRTNPGDTFRFFRASAPAPGVPGAIPFVTPGAGHTSALVALSDSVGGHVTLGAFAAQSGVIDSQGPIAVDWAPIFAKSIQGEIGNWRDFGAIGDVGRYAAFNLSWKKIKPRLQNGMTVIATIAGRVTFGGIAYTVSGVLSDTGLLNLTLKNKAQTLQTQLEWSEAGNFAGFDGSLVTSSGVFPIALVPSSHRGTTADTSPHAGKTLNVVLLESEASPSTANLGHAFLRAVISRTGSASLSGRLPDGTAFTASARGVTESSGRSRLFFHRILPSKLGHLLGDFFLPLTVNAANGEFDLLGDLVWIKAERPKSLFHPEPLTGKFEARGIRWIKPVGSLLDSVPGQGFAVTFDPLGVTAAGAFSQGGVWNDKNKPSFVLAPSGTTFSFAVGTGLFSGSRAYFMNGRTLKAPYRGIMLPRPIPVYLGDPPIQGFGYLNPSGESGAVELKPITP